jgi:hypothetical protein
MFRIFNINYIFPAFFINYSAGEGYIIIIEKPQSYIKLLGIAILCLLLNIGLFGSYKQININYGSNITYFANMLLACALP